MNIQYRIITKSTTLLPGTLGMSFRFKEKHSCLYLQCTCVNFSQQAGMPTFQIVPTLHLNIALLVLWGTPFSLQDKPSETEYLYLCTIIGTIQTHRSQIQMQAILLLKIHVSTQPLGERGEGLHAYVANTSGLIAQILRVMVTSFCGGAVV